MYSLHSITSTLSGGYSDFRGSNGVAVAIPSGYLHVLVWFWSVLAVLVQQWRRCHSVRQLAVRLSCGRGGAITARRPVFSPLIVDAVVDVFTGVAACVVSRFAVALAGPSGPGHCQRHYVGSLAVQCRSVFAAAARTPQSGCGAHHAVVGTDGATVSAHAAASSGCGGHAVAAPGARLNRNRRVRPAAVLPVPSLCQRRPFRLLLLDGAGAALQLQRSSCCL